ncbi:hypothetical protein HMP09_0434 [Sphingomonas sp. HMP9]|nr:hypothetical protein HMP09_0434 [Sphingomonas sp. HMP9]
MAVTQEHIGAQTPMGATLVDAGATFRVWAPLAREVHVCGDFNGWAHDALSLLKRQDDGRWAGFVPGLAEGHLYKFYVVGEGSEGFKRDPYARELTRGWPGPACILRSPTAYTWHDAGWRPPAFSDLIVYQLHIGTWAGPAPGTRVGTFLDVLDRIEYLADLGINAIEPLPIIEYSTPRSMGYNGSDLFSPEMDYQVPPGELGAYLPTINRLLAQKGHPPLSQADLSAGINQLKVMIDICHLYGIAVLLDIVFNHASGDIKGQPESLYFFDRAAGFNPNDSLYFSERDHTGPVFAFWNRDVRQFLIDNATFFLDEYHIDGFRYDQVTVIDRENAGSGWLFCQDLTDTLRHRAARAIDIAEYWGPEPAVVRPREAGGAGFDAIWHDGLRETIRGLLAAVAGGRDAPMSWQALISQLRAPRFREAWRCVQCIESHDEVYHDREPRIAALAGGGNSRSWFATSRARVATGLLLTAPGIPMLFMGQEFFEDKRWSDDPASHPGTSLYWSGLSADKTMTDFHRFTRELISLRRRHPALRGENCVVRLADDVARVIVVHRWLEGSGRDVVIVASLNESTHHGFSIPMPSAGHWTETFNSDLYENWVNPVVAGNGGSVMARNDPTIGLPCSASLTIPANAFLVLTRDGGD